MKNIAHIKEWKLHDLPFTFYNNSKHLANYNVVNFLNQHRIHNIGIYQRLCGCYNEIPFGQLSYEMLSQFQATNANPHEMFQVLGLPEVMFPLSKPIKKGIDPLSIDSCKALYEAKEWSFDNPAALVLDVPMTIYYLINKYCLKELTTQGESFIS